MMTIKEESAELLQAFEELIESDIETKFATSLSISPGLRQRLEIQKEPLRQRIRNFRRRMEREL